MMTNAERHVGRPQQCVRDFSCRRVVGIHLSQGATLVDDKAVQNLLEQLEDLQWSFAWDGIIAARVEHTGAIVVSEEEYGLHFADHDTALCPKLLKGGRISLLRHDATDTGELSFRQHEPRRRRGVLCMNVLRELPQLDGGDLQYARNLKAAVHRSNMIGVVGILDESIKAQQVGQPLSVDREAGRTQRSG